MKKTESKKSRDTVPLNNCFLPLYLSFVAEFSAIWQQWYVAATKQN
jgi:hypothetical protein